MHRYLLMYNLLCRLELVLEFHFLFSSFSPLKIVSLVVSYHGRDTSVLQAESELWKAHKDNG